MRGQCLLPLSLALQPRQIYRGGALLSDMQGYTPLKTLCKSSCPAQMLVCLGVAGARHVLANGEGKVCHVVG